MSKCRIKGDKYFVDEVETHLREKPLRGSQTQDIHYSEDKTSYKAVAESFTLWPTPKIDFKLAQQQHTTATA